MDFYAWTIFFSLVVRSAVSFLFLYRLGFVYEYVRGRLISCFRDVSVVGGFGGRDLGSGRTF